MGILSIKRSTIILFIIMLVIFFSGIWYANFYYQGVNDSEDPRVVRAKELYNNYNQLAEENKYQEIFDLLDSIEIIYNQFDDYRYSYEVGVLYNNRAALCLNMALFEPFTEMEKDSLIQSAQSFIYQGIRIYENWNAEFALYSEADFQSYLNAIYFNVFPLKDSSEVELFISKRSQEMMDAQLEMNRRLSVVYTNLGIVLRYQNQVKEAVESYQMALELWDKNITAENNINILLGKPLKTRSIIDRLFPDE